VHQRVIQIALRLPRPIWTFQTEFAFHFCKSDDWRLCWARAKTEDAARVVNPKPDSETGELIHMSRKPADNDSPVHRQLGFELSTLSSVAFEKNNVTVPTIAAAKGE
jgi:hypothetical protein